MRPTNGAISSKPDRDCSSPSTRSPQLRTWGLVAIVCFLCVTLIVGLGGGAVAVASTGAAPIKPLPIRVGAFSTVNANVWWPQAAQTLGAYQKVGLKAKVTVTSPNNITALLLSRQIDVMCSTPFFYNVLFQGVPAVTVVGIGDLEPYTLVTTQSINSIKDLAGKSIAVTAIGASDTYGVVVNILKANGVDPDSIKWVVIGDPVLRVQAMAAGRLDAGIVTQGTYPTALQAGLKVLVPDAGKYFAVHPWFGCFALKSYADSHPTALGRFAEAMIRTQRMVAGDFGKFLILNSAVGKDILNGSQAGAVFKIMRQSGFYSLNGGLQKSWYTQNATLQAGLRDPPPSTIPKVTDYFRTQYVKYALDRIGVVPDSFDKARWYTPPKKKQ
jgi:NitT/TauT family transport system substrate-binding protein